MLEVKKMTVRYGSFTALREISFTLDKGESIGMIGANGAGKTTLLTALAGALPQACGQLLWKKEELSALNTAERVKKGIILVPEGRRLFGELTVWENLLAGGHLLGGRAANSQAEELLRGFPTLLEKKGELAQNLSGGQQQLVAILRGLMARPKLLLVDEPTMGLTPAAAKEIYTLLQRQQSLSMIVTVHSLKELPVFCKRALVLQSGRVVYEGPSAALNEQRIKKLYTGC